MRRSSRKWISEHLKDPYVKKAHKARYRSRAAFKLLQIQEKFQMIRAGDRVLDLGAAPGGWTQVAVGIAGASGLVVAVDRLRMAGVAGAKVLQGDLMNDETVEKVRSVLGREQADLILSDMAPNTSGIPSLDHDRSAALVQSVFRLVPLFLKPGGGVVVKIFQGKEFKALTEAMRAQFQDVHVFKPRASRPGSVEIYLVGKGYRGIGSSSGPVV